MTLKISENSICDFQSDHKNEDKYDMSVLGLTVLLVFGKISSLKALYPSPKFNKLERA